MSKLDLDDYLPYLLNRAGAKIADAFGRETRRHGITLQMWRVLAALNQQDGQSVGELARRTSIEISTLSRLLDQMQKKRLLLRRRDSEDQRSVTVHRSAAALAITETLIPVALAYEARALEGLDRNEAKTLKVLLRRIYDSLDRLEEIGEAPKQAVRPKPHGRPSRSRA